MTESMTGSGGTLRITLVRSTIGRPKDQGRTVRALGLRRLHQTVERVDNPSIRGMVNKIHHLVRVEQVPNRGPGSVLETSQAGSDSESRAGSKGPKRVSDRT